MGKEAYRFTKFKGRVVRIELSVSDEDGFNIIYSHSLE